jgi:alpha-tubulin suppressor-like RCC1 family protein
MMTQKEHVSVTSLWANSKMLVSLSLFSLLAILPAASHAATPWYSHGKNHTLTLTEDGKVWALGSNEYGELGNGKFGGESHEPKIIKGLDDVVAVLAGGGHSVALKKDGSVWTWGLNSSGQLGNGTIQSSAVPGKIAGISNVKSIATGNGHIIALKQDGTVWGWGSNNSGQVGNGRFQNCAIPTQVPGLRDVTAIVAGAFNTSALKRDGTLWSWGFNGKGQLGNGSNEKSSTPVKVAGLTDVHAVAAGDWHVVALKHDGTVWGWGSNDSNQLGQTSAEYSFAPVQVAGIQNITDLTASIGHTIAIAKNDSVWAWGDAGNGQWGNGASLEGSTTPVQVSSYNGLVTIAAVVNPSTVLRDKIDSSSIIADAGIGSTTTLIRIKEVIKTASL